MTKMLTLETDSKLLNLRTKLNTINNISYAYARLNKSHPLDLLSEGEALKLVKIYENLMLQVEELVKNGNQDSTT